MRTVRLIKEHKHAGQRLKPGAQIVLQDRTAAWLIEQGVAVPLTREVPALLRTRLPETAAELKPPQTIPTARRRRGCAGCGWNR